MNLDFNVGELRSKGGRENGGPSTVELYLPSSYAAEQCGTGEVAMQMIGMFKMGYVLSLHVDVEGRLLFLVLKSRCRKWV